MCVSLLVLALGTRGVWATARGCLLTLFPLCLPLLILFSSPLPVAVAMVSGLYMLLWVVATALLSRLAVAMGPVVRCDLCDTRALKQCKPMVPECLELVREPGCGCCLTCALQEGQPCGVYTERCGSELSCRPRSGEPKPLQALLDGKGLCINVSGDAAGGSSSSSASNRVRDFLFRGTHKPGKKTKSRSRMTS